MMNDHDDPLTIAGQSPEMLRELAVRADVARIDFHRTVDSTQDVARALAELGVDEWSVVVANEQTAGRGQHGRSWRDRQGRSLLISIILRPSDPAAMSLIPVRTALAIAEAIEPSAERIAIKWPNDLILDDRKLGGILVEAQTRGNDLVAIVGIGLNVLDAPRIPDDPTALTPVALTMLDPGVDRLETLVSILTTLRRSRFLSSHPTLEPAEIAAFESRDWLRGRRLVEPLAGIARGIDMSGHLVVVEEPGIVRHVLSGRVR
jgi:BirA family biotin operon repressor/biotin-[acetyl-CoA-carboxylase] ligase